MSEFELPIRVYIACLEVRIPSYIYHILLTILFIGFFILLICFGIKRGIRYSLYLILVEYFALIICSTVIYRNELVERDYHFKPFWSYYTSNPNHFTFLPDHIMNVAVFIPIGIIIGALMRKREWIKILCFGLLLSLTIELLQFVFKKGTCEIDDLMNNTLGCLLGALFIFLIRNVLKKFLNCKKICVKTN